MLDMEKGASWINYYPFPVSHDKSTQYMRLMLDMWFVLQPSLREECEN